MAVWSYGITTVPSRIGSGLLEKTLNSLDKAGFSNPRLFVDGLPNEALGESINKLSITCHNPAIRLQGNFHLGLSELFIREPHADYYAMFQDDLVTYPNLREYLEACPYPGKGYLNLYTFKQNERPQKGWYLSNQLGKGAVALVFNLDAAKVLLQSPHWLWRPATNPKNKGRNWKFVDGGIVEAFRQQRYKEYVHNPSLVQHTGKHSTLGNSRHAQAQTFRGEDFNAMDLLPKPTLNKPEAVPSSSSKLHKRNRIGLVGYCTDKGVGKINKQISENVDLYRWLIRPHPTLGIVDPPEDVDIITCPIGVKIKEFLTVVDTVLVVGEACYANLLKECRDLGKQVIFIPPDISSKAEEWTELNKIILTRG
jgi:hypothetical protein